MFIIFVDSNVLMKLWQMLTWCIRSARRYISGSEMGGPDTGYFTDILGDIYDADNSYGFTRTITKPIKPSTFQSIFAELLRKETKEEIIPGTPHGVVTNQYVDAFLTVRRQ